MVFVYRSFQSSENCPSWVHHHQIQSSISFPSGILSMKYVSYLISTSVSGLTKLLYRVRAVTYPKTCLSNQTLPQTLKSAGSQILKIQQTNPKVTILRGFDCGGGGGKKNQLAADVVVLKSAQTTRLEKVLSIRTMFYLVSQLLGSIVGKDIYAIGNKLGLLFKRKQLKS